jgi:hypothetical protein
MNTLIKNAVAALALAAASAASAQAQPAVSAPATAPATVPAPAAETKHAQPHSGRTRAEVIAEVIEARRNGTLIETEADMDVAQTRKHLAR